MKEEFNLLERLNLSFKELNALDEYYKEIPNIQSNIDSKLSDLYHYIENNKLSTNQCYRIVKEIKTIRQQRRKINQDWEMFRVYKANINKIINTDNRSLLFAELKKTEKKLNSIYKNRIYSEEEIKSIIGN